MHCGRLGPWSRETTVFTNGLTSSCSHAHSAAMMTSACVTSTGVSCDSMGCHQSSGWATAVPSPMHDTSHELAQGVSSPEKQASKCMKCLESVKGMRRM
eukprot:6214566-Pleurochrysis_carterae.AAC.7